MTEIDFSDPDGLLDRVVTALREEPIPDFSDPCTSLCRQLPAGTPTEARGLGSKGWSQECRYAGWPSGQRSRPLPC